MYAKYQRNRIKQRDFDRSLAHEPTFRKTSTCHKPLLHCIIVGGLLTYEAHPPPCRPICILPVRVAVSMG